MRKLLLPVLAALFVCSAASAQITATLTATPNPVEVGQPVELKVVITGTTIGTVRFYIDGVAVTPTFPVVGGVARISTVGYYTGTRRWQALWFEGTDYAYSNTVSVQTVGDSFVTTTTLSPSANPLPAGQALTLTASVTSSAGVVGGGSVAFYRASVFANSADLLARVPLQSGGASLTIADAPPGLYYYWSAFSGYDHFRPSESAELSEVVEAPGAMTKVSVTTAPNPSTVGEAITITIDARRPDGSLAYGRVTTTIDGAVFSDQASIYGSPLTFPTTFTTPGAHTIRAQFHGGGNAVPSSASIVQVVKAVSTVTVDSIGSETRLGVLATFTAAVSPKTATGFVDFVIDGGVVSSSRLSNGGASFSTYDLPAGVHRVVASYGGDDLLYPAVSAPITYFVVAPLPPPPPAAPSRRRAAHH